MYTALINYVQSPGPDKLLISLKAPSFQVLRKLADQMLDICISGSNYIIKRNVQQTTLILADFTLQSLAQH